MSLELTLQNALSGLQTSQVALQTISNNIANANTEGYSRKIADPKSKVVDGRGFGVEVGQIKRRVDDGVLRLLRTETGNSEKLTEQDRFLSQAHQFFGRPEDNNSITHLIAELGSQFDALAVSPESEAAHFLAVDAGADILRKLEQMSDEIQRLRADADVNITSAITEFNSAADTVADTNLQIISFSTTNLNSTELEDQRDAALNTLAKIMDINYFQSNTGALTVFAGGGQTIINGAQKQALSYSPPSTYTSNIEYTPRSSSDYIGPGSTGHPVGGVPGIFAGEVLDITDITTGLSSGRLKGLIDIRDSELPGLQAQLDELAEKLKAEINAVHNKGSGFPPAVGLTGDRYVASATSFDATGLIRVGIVNDTGALQEDKLIDLSTLSTVGDLVTSLSAMTNLTASINTSDRLELVTSNNFRVAINELTSSVSAAGDLSRGFSDFFGLNRFIDSVENFSRYRSDAFNSSTGDVVTTAGTLQFTGNDGTAFTTTVNYVNTDTLDSLAAKINANGTLEAEGITATVVSDGNKVRLELVDSSVDEFAIVETNNGTVLSDINLRTDTRGLSNRMKIRTDLQENNSLISRGTLQSNTFLSKVLNSKTAAFNATSPTASAGALTFTINASTTVAINYAVTNDLEDVASAINSNVTLGAANIKAEVVADGSNFKLKIVDENADDFMIVDSGGLTVDVSQGVSFGDSSVAEDLAAAFNNDITFSETAARGEFGGLATSITNLGNYSSKILSVAASRAFTVERELKFQENLKDELFTKNSAISAVNMDEELSNMIIFEQAFLAAARLVTTTQEMFKVLTDML